MSVELGRCGWECLKWDGNGQGGGKANGDSKGDGKGGGGVVTVCWECGGDRSKTNVSNSASICKKMIVMEHDLTIVVATQRAAETDRRVKRTAGSMGCKMRTLIGGMR